MIPEMYADSIGEITLTGSVLRIDLVTLSATQRDSSNNPIRELRQRIIMPIEGYAGSFDLLKRVFDSLVESGALNRRSPGAAATASAPAAPGTQQS